MEIIYLQYTKKCICSWPVESMYKQSNKQFIKIATELRYQNCPLNTPIEIIERIYTA